MSIDLATVRARTSEVVQLINRDVLAGNGIDRKQHRYAVAEAVAEFTTHHWLAIGRILGFTVTEEIRLAVVRHYAERVHPTTRESLETCGGEAWESWTAKQRELCQRETA